MKATDEKGTAEVSPFHRGEQRIQTQLGVRDRMERFGSKVIRGYMPEQHREFYQQLEYLFVGHVDNQGWPWASILLGGGGFIQSPDNTHLNIDAQPITGDPLAKSLKNGDPLGLLGIELSTRRRNRLAGHVIDVRSDGMQIEIDQAFGNCPKYIQARKPIESVPSEGSPVTLQSIQQFDASALALITSSDTFFVASFVDNGSGLPSEGIDISHRGGLPGFIHIDSELKLTIPDYSGNLHFNTLGNFLENPKAGLLFIDFETGDILSLTGRVEILWDAADVSLFAGAERLWTFELDHGVWLNNALPKKWEFETYSPFLAGEK